jgi:alpha-L-rhamnosidase
MVIVGRRFEGFYRILALTTFLFLIFIRGYMVNNHHEPATTVWELWQAPVFGPGMNSRNHIMFGTVSSWFFKYLAGIQPMEPGYQHISVQPSGQSTLEHASAKIATPFGDILSSWEKRNGSYVHTITIPPGATATLLVPLSVLGEEDNFTIMEGGSIVWEKGRFVAATPGVIAGVQLAEGIKFQLSNGRYVFQTESKTNLRAEFSR